MKRQIDTLSLLFSKNLAYADQNNSMLWTKDYTLFSNYFPIIWPSSSSDWQNSVELTARVILTANLSLVDMLFSQATQLKQTA